LNLESRNLLEVTARRRLGRVRRTRAAAQPSLTVGASGVVGRPFFERRDAHCTGADTRAPRRRSHGPVAQRRGAHRARDGGGADATAALVNFGWPPRPGRGAAGPLGGYERLKIGGKPNFSWPAHRVTKYVTSIGSN
jgi:hypothetical protein